MTKQLKELSPVMVTPEGELALLPSTLVESNPGEDSLLSGLLAGELNPEFGIFAAKSAKKKEEDEEDDDPDTDDDADKDDWEKGEGEEEEEEWDPDFDEFDLPKSGKKAGKAGSDEEDDTKVDEDLSEFDDLFGDSGDDFDDDDDY
jgi:hypothetical protein